MFKKIEKTEMFVSDRAMQNAEQMQREIEFRRNVKLNRTPTVEEAFNQIKNAIQSERRGINA